MTPKRTFLILFLSAAALFLTAGILAAVNFYDVHSLLIIHFDIFHGINTLGTKEMIYGMLGIAGACILINYFLAKKLIGRQDFLSYFLAFGSVILGIITLIEILVLINVNL